MSAKNGHRLLGPAVRMLLSKYGLKSVDVKPTGPKKNLLKDDVLQHTERAKLEPIRGEPSHVSAEGRVVHKSMQARRKRETYKHPVFY